MNNINVRIDTQKEQERTNDVPALCQKAEITISTQTEFELASVVLKEVKSRYKELEAQRKAITMPLDDAKKAIMELFRQPLTALESAETKLKGLMLGYTAEQERKAREEQARLQKLADQEAEKQRKALEAKIERAKASGKEEKAEMLEMEKENIIPITAPVVAPQIEKPAGISYRDQWSAEVIDEKLVPREYLIVNLQALNKIAAATKGTITVPGVRFVSTKILASR